MAAFAAAVALAFAAPSAAQDLWPKMHRDPANTGSQSDASQSPGLTLAPAWTYPWPSSNEDDLELIIDDSDQTGSFSALGNWTSPPLPANPSSDPYDETYRQAKVQTPDNSIGNALAIWTVPATQTKRKYTLWVWFPSSTSNAANTLHATYEVFSASGVRIGRYVMSQQTGGRWIQIGTKSLVLGPGYQVRLSNFSDYKSSPIPDPTIPGQPGGSTGQGYVDNGRFVVADAIRLVEDNGQIYSSPAVFSDAGLGGSGKGVVFAANDDVNTETGIDVSGGWGRILCVDAINGPDQTKNTPIWQYPNPTPSLREPLEGPLALGVYSSALVARTTAGHTVFIGAEDGQIYALDASTGNLRWSGPGQTLDDLSPDAVEPSSGFAPNVPPGDDATFFGSRYLTVEPGAGEESITYTFTGLQNYYYNVYAWIPPQPSGLAWVSDAHYKVKSANASAEQAFSLVQGNCGGGSERGGRWLQVGTAFLPSSGQITVTLDNKSAGQSCADDNDTAAVVADAIRVVPDSIKAFGYNPVTAVDAGNNMIDRIYAGNIAGRIIALDADGDDQTKSTDIAWIYPEVRRKKDESDKVSLGPISGGVAISGSTMYYGSSSGRFGRLDNIDGSTPSAAWEQFTDSSGNPVTSIGNITAAPMIDSTGVYFATSQGYLYSVSTGGSIQWTYPKDWNSDPTTPSYVAGSFRYSSPAIAQNNSGDKFVVIGSADSFLHVIPVSGPGGTDPLKLEQPGAVYSSPATARQFNSSEPFSAYFGTNAGVVIGTALDSDDPVVWGWSTLGDMVFSSPAVADRWVYAGSSDGRMYAFARGTSGGGGGTDPWRGGPNWGRPPGREHDHSHSGGTAFLDVEIVRAEDYNDPQAYFEKANLFGSSGSANRQPSGKPDYTLSSGDNRVEWGETMYAIAWTIQKPGEDGNKGATIRLQLQNIGQGEQASTVLMGNGPASTSWKDTDGVTVKNIDVGDPSGAKYEVWFVRIAYTPDVTRMVTPGSEYIVRADISGSRHRGTGSLYANVPVSKSTRSTFTRPTTARSPDKFAINHPLAISFPTLGAMDPKPGWGSVALNRGGFQPKRNDNGTDYNGMGTAIVPQLVAPPVRHGANTTPVPVLLADRSALGYFRPNQANGLINTLRASRGDMGFPGSPINPMPWEIVPVAGYVNSSPDYPDISKNQITLVKSLDGGTPAKANATLLPSSTPAHSPNVNQRWASADPLDVFVEVPRYQPPGGLTGAASTAAYGTRMRVWVDTMPDGKSANGHLDLADTVVTGRPLTASEPFREWDYAVAVMPEAQMYAEERVIDAKNRPIGFGVYPNPDPFLPFAGYTLPGGVPARDMFEPFTIRNGGNVNLSNLEIMGRLPVPPAGIQDVYLFSDQVQAVDLNKNGLLEPNKGEGFGIRAIDNVVSSLNFPAASLAYANLPSSDPSRPAPLSNPQAYMSGKGWVLGKPRVGDLGPTTLEIPDRRLYNYFQPYMPMVPSRPLISTRVPIGTPSGTYSGPIYVMANLGPLGNPYTNPSFDLKVTVREARMTDGTTAGAIPQIDASPVDPAQAQVGDAQPTAFRAWTGSGGVASDTSALAMLWTSNRFGDASSAVEPWYLYASQLPFASGTFQLGSSAQNDPRWWTQPDQSTALPISYRGDLASLFPADPAGLAGSIVDRSEKFTSPSIGQDPGTGTAWVTFVGQVDKRSGAGTRTEYRLFVGRMEPDGSINPSSVASIPTQDFSAPKFSPRIMPVDGNRLYVFWHSGAAGQYRLFYAYNGAGGAPDSWRSDSQLVIPAAVTAAAEPVPVPRTIQFHADMTPVNQNNQFVDLAYSAVTRHSGNADLLLSRYRRDGSSLNLQKLPRVYTEELARDTRTTSLYFSKHLAWVRPTNNQTPGSSPDIPIIEIRRWDPAASTLDPPDRVSEVPAKVDSNLGLVVYDPSLIADQAMRDRFTTLYGRVVVDTSNGTVRFEKPRGTKDLVVADYTPQTWRLSTDAQPDTSPFALLEKTRRVTEGSNRDAAIFPTGFEGRMHMDRRWTFWRREGAGGQRTMNTIYYSTDRLGIQLSRQIAVDNRGKPVNLVVHEGGGNYAGAYEVDIANRRVLFTEDAENRPIWIEYLSPDGVVYNEPQGATTAGSYRALSWIAELPSTTLLTDSSVNEGQPYAFADPDGLRDPSSPNYKPTLIWVFWTSSRTGSSDVFYEAISPSTRPVTAP